MLRPVSGAESVSTIAFIEFPSQNLIRDGWGCRLARFCQCKALLKNDLTSVVLCGILSVNL